LGSRIRNTGTFPSYFNDKSHKEVTKQYKPRVFLLFLLDDGAGSVLLTNGSGCGSGRLKNIRYGSFGSRSGCGSGSATLLKNSRNKDELRQDLYYLYIMAGCCGGE
jgi:hypothetical protein